MKKLLATLLVFVSLITLTACGNETVEGTLEEIMETVYSDVYAGVADDQKPMLGNINVSTDMKDNIGYYIGTDEIDAIINRKEEVKVPWLAFEQESTY